MTFGVLALIVLAGLAGPLLSSGRRALVPVVVGELAAGIVIGRSGFGWLDPNEPTTAFLAEVGFAMLMFVAGMHVPLRQPGLLSGVRRGGLAAAVAGLLAPVGGIAVAQASGTHHAAIYALLLASGSAAILLPALQEQGLLGDPRALTVMAQVAIADIAAIVLLPIVLEPDRAFRAAALFCDAQRTDHAQRALTAVVGGRVVDDAEAGARVETLGAGVVLGDRQTQLRDV